MHGGAAFPDERGRTGGGVGPPRPASREIRLQDLHGIGRQREQAGFMELGRTDQEGLGLEIVIAEGEPEQLTPAQPGGVEQHHPHVQRLRPEPRGRGGRPVVGGHQQSGDLVLRQDVGRCVLMRGREAGPIRDEARRLRPAAVETELAHHTHLRALVPGFQVGLGPAPALEHLQRELGRVLGHQKRVEEGKHASLHRIAPS